MPRYCPECRGEFRDEVIACPDCDVELVAEWALAGGEEESDHGPPVTVLSTRDVVALAVAKSLLDEANIPFAVWNERAIEVFPGSEAGSALRDRFGDTEVQVPQGFEVEARALLEQLDVEE